MFPPSPKKNQFPFRDSITKVRCNRLNIIIIVIIIIIIIKRSLRKPFVRVVMGNIKYSDSKETDIPNHEKNSVTDFWGKSKQQRTFHKAFSPSTFIAKRAEITHLSAPHCVQMANVIDESEGLICPTKALRCPEISTLITGLPKTTSLTESFLLYSRHSMWKEI